MRKRSFQVKKKDIFLQNGISAARRELQGSIIDKEEKETDKST